MTANYLDIAFLAVLGLFTLRGLFRGLVEEIAGLVGVIGGFWLANKHHGAAAEYVRKVVVDPAWVSILSYVLVFLGVLLVVSLVARVLRRLLELSFAGWLDHLAGGVAGIAKGVLICSILLALLLQFLPEATFVRESRVIPHLSQVTSIIKEYLPQQIRN